MPNLGPLEFIVITTVALLLFGAGRIADIGKGLGQGIKNFKHGLSEAGDPNADADDGNPEKRLKSAATADDQTAKQA